MTYPRESIYVWRKSNYLIAGKVGNQRH